MQRPTQWPDGRKLGGLNGYPPEYFEWAKECQVKFVAQQMLLAPAENRSAVFKQWQQKFTHVTREKISAVWDEVANRKTPSSGEANGH